MSDPSAQQLLDRLRRNLERADGPDCRRLWHGRGNLLPDWNWLTVDWYPPVLHLVSYRPATIEHLQPVLDGLRCALEPAAMLLQRRDLPETPHQLLEGTLPTEVDAVEQGLRYRLDFSHGRNIGFFPDMATGRTLVRQRAEGRKILNLFAYTCAFSVAALAGGAAQVVNVDMSRSALERGRFNHRLNQLDVRRASFLPHDVLRSFGKLKRLGPFDLVILDPPDTQGSSFRPERDWPKLLRRLPELLRPGGEVLACMAVPRLGLSFLEQTVAEHAPFLQRREHHTAGPDFPETDPDKGLHLNLYSFDG